MSYTNPYAAPATVNPFAETYASPAGYPGLWREGNLLVMHKLAPLPDICLKSNLPANRRLRRKMSWHHPAVFLAIVVHVLVYLVIALIVQKKATIYIPLTEEWFAKRRTRMMVAWGMVAFCILMIIVGITMLANENTVGVLFLVAGVVIGLITVIVGLLACRLVTPTRMTDEYIWLKGVHPDYLNRLQVWPYRI
jgi:hypothetical protein